MLSRGATYLLAVQADGTVKVTGSDDFSGKSIAKAKTLKGVFSATSSKYASAFLGLDGSVEVIMFKKAATNKLLSHCTKSGHFSKVPPHLVATQVALGDCLAAAIDRQGDIHVWGSIDGSKPDAQVSQIMPKSDSAKHKKVRKVLFGRRYAAPSGAGSLRTLVAVMVDGSVEHWQITGAKGIWKKSIAQASNVADIAVDETSQMLLRTTFCGGIGYRGCCDGDTLKTCSETTKKVHTSTCKQNTCGWHYAQVKTFGPGAFSCNSSIKGTPVGVPYIGCKCQPWCGYRTCGTDGCGGSCGKCTHKAATCNTQAGICECTPKCNDGNLCTNDSCHPTKGCVHTANTLNCDAGKCSTEDKCVAKVCVAGKAVTCDDNNACTHDSCKIDNGCESKAFVCNDNNPCTDDSCKKATGCFYAHNSKPCSDGSKCTTNDVCGSGKCKPGPAHSCDDANGCTNDSCNPTTGCKHIHNTLPCGDSDACTQKGACSAGKCKPGAKLACNDNNPCTEDICDVKNGCTKPKKGPCSDNNACTNGDVCSAGKCKPGNMIKCDDGNVCTTDACSAQKGCVYAQNTLVCDDGNSCSKDDKCDGGKCKGKDDSGKNCDDNNPCTTVSCDGKGGCKPPVFKANTTKCDDDDACTTAGTCTDGKCDGIASIDCNDGNPCTIDTCTKSAGCKHANNTAPCDDGNPCTAGDKCSSGTCQAGGGCADNAVCTLSGDVGKCVCKAGHVGDGKKCSECKKDCENKQCGADGCGDSCGTCKDGTLCSAAKKCVCAPKCDGRECGPDGCDGSCGTCSKGLACNHFTGKCGAVCLPKCQDKTCGPDGCGGSCGTCGDGKFCIPSTGTCRSALCPSVPEAGCCVGNTLLKCGDKGLDADNCNASQTWCDWNASTKSYGCVDKLTGGDSSKKHPRTCGGKVCKPDCKGKSCGPDGCGWFCGEFSSGGKCPNGKLCNFETGGCYPDPCAGIGTNGCCKDGSAVGCDPKTRTPTFSACGTGPASCGWTGKSYTCDGNGKAAPGSNAPLTCPASLCVPKCKDKNCGKDGCGGNCGLCATNQDCFGGVCCQPNCWGRNCGSDGCGGSCGKCDGVGCNEVLGVCMSPGECGGAPYDVGCCAGQMLRRCHKPLALAQKDCSKHAGYCGWDVKVGRYECGTFGGAGPAGLPKACKGSLPCKPDCAGKKCGPDGCGGYCPNLCAKGMECNDQGQCVAGCGDIPVAGCCANGRVYRCNLNGANGAASMFWYDCKSKGYGCGYRLDAKGVADIGCVVGKGTADPKGLLKVACAPSALACKKKCDGKKCGDDGCGGSCGSCPGIKQCDWWSGKCYVPGAGCKGETWKGTCSGSKLAFCSAATRLVTKDCGVAKWQGKGQQSSSKPLCQYLPDTGANGCAAFNPLLGQTTNCSYWKRCGVFDKGAACQCDLGCYERGDCCDDFEVGCSENLSAAEVCGDGKCNFSKGEGCVTCPADCSYYCLKDPSTNHPPWKAPFTTVLDLAGTRSQRAVQVITALDQVLPGVPPVPQNGLLGYVSSWGLSSGDPSNHVTFGNLGSEVVAKSAGVQGASLGLLGPAPKPSGRVVRIALDKTLPRRANLKNGLVGGVSLAMWVKIDADAPDTQQPLASMYGNSMNVRERCTWSRPGDASATLQCPNGMKVVGLHGYYGAVEKAPLPHVGFPSAPIHSPHRLRCSQMASFRPTHACKFAGIQPWLEAQCLGKNSCHIEPWKAVKDPCGTPPHITIKSTLMVRARCAFSQPLAMAMLSVGDAAGGRRLRFRVPGFAPLVGKSNMQSAKWRHVALVYRRFVGSLKSGVTTLYVDGKPEATSETLQMRKFNHLWLGATTVGYWPAGAANVLKTSHSSRKFLAMVGDLDDVHLYERALSDREVRALRDKPELHLARVWPGVDPKLQGPMTAWSSGGVPKTSIISADKLLGPLANTGLQEDERLTASWRGLHVPSNATLRLPTPVGSLAKAKKFTLAAWIKASSPKAGTTLLQLEQNGKSSLSVASDAACGGQSLVAKGSDGVATKVNGCAHGLAPLKWTFVSVVQDGKGLSLRVDGYEIGNNSASPVLLPGAATMATLTVKGWLHLGWAALFDEALDVDALQRWRSSGPSVWLDGATYSPKNTTSLRDYADFLNVTTGPNVAQRPVAWNKAGAVATGKGPLVLTLKAGGSNAAAMTVPRTGRFATADAKSARPTTWSGHLTFALPAVGTQAQVPLIESRPAGGAERLFGARLLCDPVAASGGPKALCRVEMRREPHFWSTEQWLLSWPHSTPGGAVSIDVAVAWGDDTPRVAVGARVPKQAKQNVALAGRTLKVAVVKSAGPWPISAAVWPSQSPVLASVAPVTPASVTLGEVRLYPRALKPTELEKLVRRTCADSPCDNRVCAHADPLALPACGPCKDSHFEAGDQMGDICLPRRAFGARCQGHEQCFSKFCSNGRCLARSETKECVDACTGRARDCISYQDKSFGKKTTIFTCKGSCWSYYTEPPKYDSWASTCIWAPTVADAQPCSLDKQCISGKCVPNDRARYGGGVIGGKVCAYATKTPCEEQHRDALAIHDVPLTGKPVYTCGGCIKQLYAGKPLWREAFSIMTHAACKKGMAGGTYYTYKQGSSTASYQSCLHGRPLSGPCLRELLLGKYLQPSKKDIADMRTAGVGPDLVRYILEGKHPWPAQWLAFCHCNGVCPPGAVVNPPAPPKLSIWHDPAYNYPVCVGAQFPNGATCPPPGIKASEAEAHQFCESGYCQRGTNKCGTLRTRIEDTQAADRQDTGNSLEKGPPSNKSDLHYGPITITQHNSSTIKFGQAYRPVGSKDAPKRIYEIAARSTHTARLFNSKALPLIDLGLGLRGEMDDKKARVTPRFFLFGTEMPNTNATNPPSSCPSVKWVNHQFTASTGSCAVPAMTNTGKPTYPTREFCLPVFSACRKKVAAPFCMRGTTFIGPVPVTGESSARLEACVTLGVAIDTETMEPGYTFGPEIDIGIEFSAGVGIAEFITLFAGARANLSLLNLGHFVNRMLKVEQVFGPNQTMVDGLFRIFTQTSQTWEASILRVSLTLFVEFGVGWFKAVTNYPIYDLEPLNLSWTVEDTPHDGITVDLSSPSPSQ